MTVAAVATTEVQEDSADTNAEAYADYDEAAGAAEAFMLRCVGDFLEIDPGDVEGRRRALDKRLSRETSGGPGERRLELKYECEALVLGATVQETTV